MKRFWRVQPNGASLFGHRSKLGAVAVEGVFAFTDPKLMFQTYTWIHVKKRPQNFEMVSFAGEIVAQPEDSEGVVVEPQNELSREPLVNWLSSIGVTVVLS